MPGTARLLGGHGADRSPAEWRRRNHPDETPRVAVARGLLRRHDTPVRELQGNRLPLLGDWKLDLDQVGTRPWAGVDDGHPAALNSPRDPLDGSGRQTGSDLLGLGVADEHLRRDLVGRAAADRVVRGVLEHPSPREVEQASRPTLAIQRLQRLGIALQAALGASTGGLEVDPRRGDAHQQVRTGSRAQLALPVRQSVPLGLLEVARQRRQLDLDLLAGCLDEVGQAGIRLRVVVPVHREQRVVAVERPQRLLQGDDLVHQPLRVGEQMPGVPVPPRQVLGANNGPVGRLPRERVAVDRRRDAAPHHGLFDACQPQDLRHLRDVAEHVRQVADPHRAAELVSASEPVFEVADDRLARDEELVDEREPRADYQAALSDERSDPRRCLRPNLEVVVDDAELAVEGEDVPRVVLEQVEQAIDEPDELQPKALEGEVPLPVPVGVRDELDGIT